jgi:hypothetical protein
MLRALILVALSSSVAFADASKDAVAGAVVHAPKLAHSIVDRAPVVKDDPSASKTAPLVSLPTSKLK